MAELSERWTRDLTSRGLFLESPSNFSGLGPVSRKSRSLFGPEIKYSNRNIKNKSAGPGQQTTAFCFVN